MTVEDATEVLKKDSLNKIDPVMKAARGGRPYKSEVEEAVRVLERHLKAKGEMV